MYTKMLRNKADIQVNNHSIKDEKGVLVFPGQKNFLSLRIPEVPNTSIKATVEILTPDGRRRVEESPIKYDQPWECDLGPFAVPAVYEYSAGVVYRRGYRVIISLIEEGEDAGGAAEENAFSENEGLPEGLAVRFELYQGCTRDKRAETLYPGFREKVEYNDGWIPEGKNWNPFDYSGRPMDPPLEFCLHPEVLTDQDQVKIRYRLREDLEDLAPLTGLIVGCGKEGSRVIEPCSVEAEMEWKTLRVKAENWPSGNYYFEFWPQIEGELYKEGPIIRYHRKVSDPDMLRISPLAPFELHVDGERSEIGIEDWNFQSLSGEWIPTGGKETGFSAGWEIEEREGRSVLVYTGDVSEDIGVFKLRPELTGCYAVFLKPLGSVYVRIGSGPNRPVGLNSDDKNQPDFGPVFITAEEMTGKDIEFTPVPGQESGVCLLQLVPVEEESLREFQAEVHKPPLSLRGISDWWCYFNAFASDLGRNQFDMELLGQKEVGLTSLAWAIGRSWVAYPSKLSRASVFPCTEVTDEALQDFPNLGPWEHMVNEHDALGYPLERRRAYGQRMYNWLCMNRHYSPNTRSGTHTSEWIREHPEFNMHSKKGGRDISRVEYFFEEVRRERLDIFVESLEYDADGIVVGWCRQPPHAGYHPDMVEEYREKTGIDPRKLDLSDNQDFIDWLRWRCEHGTTCFMRELREELGVIEERENRRIPIAVRVPAEGFFFNMAMGMDVETWIKEELIDELQLDPLENRVGEVGCHDVRPYLELCRRHGIAVWGGVNGSTGTIIPSLSGDKPLEWNPVVGLRMAIGLIQAGVDGLEVYESERFAHMTYERWLVPLWGNAELAEMFLNESNFESVYPVKATNAASGHDNHWKPGHSLYGTDKKPRGATWLL